MAPTKSESSSHRKGRELAVEKTPSSKPEKEGDKGTSSAESDHLESEGSVCDPNGECLPMLDP